MIRSLKDGREARHFAAFARRTVTELESLDGDAKRPDDSTTAVWAQGDT